MLSTIDIHVHLGPRWDDVKDVKATVDDLARADATAGVSMCVVSSLESLLSGTAFGAGDDPRMAERLPRGNEEILRLCRERPGLLMMPVVDPNHGDSLLAARALLADRLAVGIKLHPDRHRFHGGDFGNVMELLEEFPGKPILIHCTATRYSDPRPMLDLALAHPRVPLILAHLGRTDPPDLVIRLIRERRAENAFVDTAAMRDPTMIALAVREIGGERVLFGSDFPFYMPGAILDLIRSSGAGDADLERILGGNARRLLCLPEPPAAAQAFR